MQRFGTLRERVPMQLQDSRWQLTADSVGTVMNRQHFISCIAFGKTAEFFERFGRKGTKFVLEGRIQTGSYTNKDGQRIYTTDVVVENAEFAESKNAASGNNNSNGGSAVPSPSGTAGDGFMSIPERDEELPFH